MMGYMCILALFGNWPSSEPEGVHQFTNHH